MNHNAVEAAVIAKSISQDPSVADAFVQIVEGDFGHELVVAYAVPAEGTRVPTAQEVRANLVRGQVPVVPDIVVLVEELPFVRPGEVDVGALPAARVATVPYHLRTVQVELLCELFAAVLDVPAVGVDDDFFDLGGHSLLAARLVSRIRSVMDLEVSVRDLFEAPSVRGLIGRAPRVEPRLALERRARPARIEASFVQQQLWSAPAPANVSVAVRLTGPLDVAALRVAAADVVRRHEALRTNFHESGGVVYQVIADDHLADPSFAVQASTEAALAGALQDASARPFDLTTELPFRATLFQLAANVHALLLTLPSIAADRWSADIVLRDLAWAYAARERDRAPVWQVLAVQSADHTLWQRELLGDAGAPDSLAAHQVQYWRTALAGVPETLPLPAGAAPAEAVRDTVATVPIEVPAEVHLKLRTVARSAKATLFMVLQGAVGVLLHSIAGGARNAVPIGVPVTGRSDAALENAVGTFGNHAMLRVDVEGDPTFDDLVSRIRTSALQAEAHQDLPFAQVLDVLKVAEYPAPRVATTMRPGQAAELEFAGLAAAGLPVHSTDASYDLFIAWQAASDDDGSPAGLRGSLEYRRDLLDEPTAQRMAAGLLGVLRAAADDPGTSISALGSVAGAE